MDDFGAESQTRYVPTRIGDGDFYVEAVSLEEDEQVSGGGVFRFEEFSASVRAVSEAVTESVLAGLGALKPNKVGVEFGCKVGMAPGKLIAILVNGSAEANLKVIVEWTPPQTTDQL